MKKLNNVTLVATSSIEIPATIAAIQECCRELEFEKVLFLSHEKPANLPEYVIYVYPLGTF